MRDHGPPDDAYGGASRLPTRTEPGGPRGSHRQTQGRFKIHRSTYTKAIRLKKSGIVYVPHTLCVWAVNQNKQASVNQNIASGWIYSQIPVLWMHK